MNSFVVTDLWLVQASWNLNQKQLHYLKVRSTRDPQRYVHRFKNTRKVRKIIDRSINELYK